MRTFWRETTGKTSFILTFILLAALAVGLVSDLKSGPATEEQIEANESYYR